MMKEHSDKSNAAQSIQLRKVGFARRRFRKFPRAYIHIAEGYRNSRFRLLSSYYLGALTCSEPYLLGPAWSRAWTTCPAVMMPSGRRVAFEGLLPGKTT